MYTVESLSKSLSRASVRRAWSPYTDFTWPDDLEPGQWFFAPELMSLCHTGRFAVLSRPQQQALSFWEAVNFFSLNIHGEKSLLQGLCKRLYSRWPAEVSDYLHHFVGEENRHMTLFGTFCSRYAGKVYPSRHVALPGEFAPGEEDFLFFAKVVIFEEIVDYFNRTMAEDPRLNPLVRQINQYHHNDEHRHLAFGRTITRQIFDEYSPQWNAEHLARIRTHLEQYFTAAWREYYNPEAYHDAGLKDGYELYEHAWTIPENRAFRRRVSRDCIQFLISSGILLEEPEL